MSDDGSYDGATQGLKSLFETMYSIWKQLYQERKITKVNTVYKQIELYTSTCDIHFATVSS